MITLTRNQVRRLRAVFRRSTLGISHRGGVPELVLRAEGGQLRAQHRYADLAIEYAEPGSHPHCAGLAIPLDALADFEGAAETPVVLEAVAPDRTFTRWEDRGIPQSREYHLATPVDRAPGMPALPTSWAPAPPELLAALAEATETGTHDSTRYALNCIQLRGGRKQVVATDGRQLLVRSGFEFPWSDDVLIKGSPVFACRAISRDQPVEVGRTETHVVFRAGPWTIACEVPREVRFPDVERVIPQPGEVETRLRLDPEDAGFLETALGRLPGAGDINAPVTIDLNGQIAVRAMSAEQPGRVTELVLSKSAYTGSPLCLCTNRALLERALRLGFAEIGFTGIDSPFVCRDSAQIFAVQPLSGGSPAPADAEVIRIESGTAGGGRRSATHTETTRRTTTVRESGNGHEPVSAAEVHNRPSPGPAETTGSAGTEPQATSLAALIQEAEALHASLADVKSRTARLISGLRRQRKQSRLVAETLKSLRQLRLAETAG
jgi:hypothetical protein